MWVRPLCALVIDGSLLATTGLLKPRADVTPAGRRDGVVGSPPANTSRQVRWLKDPLKKNPYAVTEPWSPIRVNEA